MHPARQQRSVVNTTWHLMPRQYRIVSGRLLLLMLRRLALVLRCVFLG
jgi:hypothetical protein